MHVLPKGFHRIRHYGLLASSRTKAETIARARELIAVAAPRIAATDEAGPGIAGAEATDKPVHPCPCCGGRMIIIETVRSRLRAAHRPTADAARDQDRHVMMTVAPISPVSADRRAAGSLPATTMLGPIAAPALSQAHRSSPARSPS